MDAHATEVALRLNQRDGKQRAQEVVDAIEELTGFIEDLGMLKRGWERKAERYSILGTQECDEAARHQYFGAATEAQANAFSVGIIMDRMYAAERKISAALGS